MIEKIDFVITWVDSTDENWIKEKNKYLQVDKKTDTSNARYRDWGLLKYWFRSIEKNAPWVNKIFFITCGHLPKWLNLNNEKLVIVKHSDYIEKEYLPTFNSCVLELNLYKIKQLSDNFVYFNDDTFLNNKVTKEDFFKDRLPCDSFILTPIIPNGDISSYIHYNSMTIINEYFDFSKFKRENFKKIFNLKYKKYLYKNLTMFLYPQNVGLRFNHLPVSYKKSTFLDVWAKEKDYLNYICNNKFRGKNDVSQWLFQFWQLSKGDFYPRNVNFGKYYNISNNVNICCKEILKKKHKMICLNDTDKESTYENDKIKLNNAFKKRYPDKSSFEI